MVTGIERWKEYFNDYKDKYVLIGGAACNLLEEELDMNPRATKDLDLILVVEALTPDFGLRLWDFIKSANYAGRSRGENEVKHEYYRFTNPEDKTYPKQIEFFARKTGILNLPSEAHIEPISLGEDLSSMSAILMDNDYYAFTIEHSRNIENIHVASPEALICLKAKAYTEMLNRKAEGEQVDSRDIDKHKKDVFRLIAMLPQNAHFTLPEKLKNDIREFYQKIGELPNPDFFKNAGLRGLDAQRLLDLLNTAFLSFQNNTEMSTAYFSAGCFWGVEYYFKRLKGVKKTTVGFMGGTLQDPSYKQVKTGTTGHLETIAVEYDPNEVSYEALVKYFFEIHDFEQADGQGIDIGSQYLSAIWVNNTLERDIALKVFGELTQMGYHPATQIREVATFYQAEDYHQNYLDDRQETPECHVYRKVFI